MSKLDKAAKKIAAKLAGAGEKMSKEAAEALLKRIDTVEAATALKGAEKQEYLDALDTVYGDRAKRAKDLGFGEETYYHGSPVADIQEFDVNKKFTGSGGTSEGYGIYFTSNPSAAGDYATGQTGAIYPTKLKKNNYISEDAKITSKDRKFFEDLITSANDWENSVINYGDENPKKALKLAVDAAMSSENKLEGIHEIANTMYGGNLNKWGKKLDELGITGVYEPAKYKDLDVKVVMDPKNIRSTNAAFDPRFKDSPNILASAAPYLIGAGAVGAATFGGNSEAEASPASKVASKIEGAASKMSKAEAEATLARLLPEGLSKYEHQDALDRIFNNPDELAAVKQALDVTQGDVAARELAQLGQSKEVYHGTNSYNIKDFRPSEKGHYGPGVYTADSKEAAEKYGKNLYTLKIPQEYLDARTAYQADVLRRLSPDTLKKIENLSETDANVLIAKELGIPNISAPYKGYNVTLDPSKVRRPDALFDKRYKDSPNILALQGGNEGQKIAGKLLGAAKPRVDMGLGSAFEQINEPLEQLNAPRNAIVQKGSELLGKQLDISGGKVPGMAEQNAQVLQTIGDFVVPASQDIVGGSVAKVMRAAKPAAKIAKNMGLKAAEAAAKAENRTLSTAEKLLAKKPEEVLVLGNPNKPINFGTVTVKPEPARQVGLPSYGNVKTTEMLDKPITVQPPKTKETMDQIVERYKKFIK